MNRMPRQLALCRRLYAAAFLPLALACIAVGSARAVNNPPVITGINVNGAPFAGGSVAVPAAGSATFMVTVAADPDGPQSLTYLWTSVGSPAGSTFSFNNTTSATATASAFSVAGNYQFMVAVFDGVTTTNSTIVTIRVNRAPIITPGSTTATPSSVIGLNGVGSTVLAVSASDPDGGPSPLSYTWSVTARPAGSIYVFNSSQPGPTASNFDQPGNYTFQISVSDGLDAVAATVSINVIDIAPTVGPITPPAKVAFNGGSVTLSTVATDPDSGPAPLTYSWTQTGFVPAPTFSGTATSNIVSPTATATVVNSFSKPGTYTYQVAVFDGAVMVTQSVNVVVNAPPQVTSGPTATPPAVAFNGGTSSLTVTAIDPDGVEGQPTFSWSQTGFTPAPGYPAGGTASLGTPSSGSTSAGAFTIPGNYVFTVTVRDGFASDNVTATVAVKVNAPPVITAGPTATPAFIPLTNGTTTLAVTATDPDGEGGGTLSYAWTQTGFVPTPGTSGSGLTPVIGTPAGNSTTVTNFTAPGTYTFTVRVSDGFAADAVTGTVNVTVNAKPVIASVTAVDTSAPGASPATGEVRMKRLPTARTAVTATDGNVPAAALNYVWTLIGKPKPGSTVSGANTNTATATYTNFSDSSTSSAQDYVFQVQVYNSFIADSVFGTVSVRINSPPIVASVKLNRALPVTGLDGIALPAPFDQTMIKSTDAANLIVVVTDADGDPLTVTWSTVTSGITFSPNAGSSATTTGNGSGLVAGGDYVIRVLVNDLFDTSVVDLAGAAVPQGVEGTNQITVRKNASPTITGQSYSYKVKLIKGIANSERKTYSFTATDPDSRPVALRYNWSVVSAVPGSALIPAPDISAPTSASTDITFHKSGKYRVRYTANDNLEIQSPANPDGTDRDIIVDVPPYVNAFEAPAMAGAISSAAGTDDLILSLSASLNGVVLDDDQVILGNTPLRYTWTQTAFSALRGRVEVGGTSTADRGFPNAAVAAGGTSTAPAIFRFNKPGTYTFTLTPDDGADLFTGEQKRLAGQEADYSATPPTITKSVTVYPQPLASNYTYNRRLGNLSTRVKIGKGQDQAAIVGFVVSPGAVTDRTRLLVRVLGRSLSVTAPKVSRPNMKIVYSGVGSANIPSTTPGPRLLVENQGFLINNPTVGQIVALGLAPKDPTECAYLVEFNHNGQNVPSAFTVIATEADSASSGGISLVEVYDLGNVDANGNPVSDSTTAASSSPRLINISTRGIVGTGEETMIAGFVLRDNAGTGSQPVIIRGLGTSLTAGLKAGAGAATPGLALDDPRLELTQATFGPGQVPTGSTSLATNSSWTALSNTDFVTFTNTGLQYWTAPQTSLSLFDEFGNARDASQIAQIRASEAALVRPLAPGVFSTILSREAVSTPASPPIGLVEVYLLSTAQQAVAAPAQ